VCVTILISLIMFRCVAYRVCVLQSLYTLHVLCTCTHRVHAASVLLVSTAVSRSCCMAVYMLIVELTRIHLHTFTTHATEYIFPEVLQIGDPMPAWNFGIFTPSVKHTRVLMHIHLVCL
jgi:hypothetical protein